MINWFLNLSYVYQALVATIFTWSLTALGASLVFFFKQTNKNIMDAMLGFASGVMIAAAFWSLLNPAIDMAINLNMIPWLIVSIGFLSGGLLLFVGDKLFDSSSINVENKYKRSLMLITSITLHNIPEGIAVGVAFGSLMYGLDGTTIGSACMLALGIGLQNFPEGSAVSLPLRRDGYSRRRAFFYGQLSAVVEPIAGVIGAILVLKMRYLLPFILSFAAGAMIYVVVAELIPESQSNIKKSLMAFFTLVGFMVMMILDVSLG